MPVASRLALVAIAALAAPPAVASAASLTFAINANGAKEVNAAGTPNQGDLDGSAIGTITLDNGTGSGTTGTATVNLTVALIDGTLSGHHIHEAPSTTTGPIRLDFGNPTTVLTGTPTAGTLVGTFTGLSAVQVTSVLNNPSGFYYNLHSQPSFPGGAVRDQLRVVPEPATLGTLAAAGLALTRRRRA